MLTPEEILEIADTMYPLLEELNNWIIRDLIKRLMARIGRGEKPMLTATDEWQLQVYQEAGGHLQTVRRLLRRFLEMSDEEIGRIFEDAGIKSLAADNRIYTAVRGEKLALSENMVRVMTDVYQRTKGTIHNFTRTTAEESQKKFIRVLDNAHWKVNSGAQSYTAAVMDAVNEIADTQTQVVYPSGHVDTIETAVLRAVRTGTAQASGNLSIQGMEEFDWDLIRVSAHLGARYGDGGENPGNHFWWQGKLYSRSGQDPHYPPFIETTGYGTGEGLCGWNCRHSFGPGDPNHNPFKDYDSEENKKAYDLSQKQRRMERGIRKSKTRLAALQEAIDTAEDPAVRSELEAQYTRAALRLKGQNEAYNDFCKDNSLKRYEDRLQVAKWGREQARRSIGAVKSAEKPLANPQKRGIITGMEENTTMVTEQARQAIPHQEAYGVEAVHIEQDYIRSNEYRMKFRGITGNPVVEDRIAEQCRDILESRTGSLKETLVILDADKGNLIAKIEDSPGDNQIVYEDRVLQKIEAVRKHGHRLLAIHNHPEGYPPTADDCVSAYHRGYSIGVVCGHNGAVYTYEPSNVPLNNSDCVRIHNNIAYQCQYEDIPANRIHLWIEMMKEVGLTIRKWG